MMPNVVVIGAGVLGAAVAWKLAEDGADVTVLDPNPGGVASPGSFAWLNASFAADPVYNRLRHESLLIWMAMKQADASVPVTFPGAVIWEQDHFDLPAVLASQAELGRDAKMLTEGELAEREPKLASLPDTALLLADDGYGDPARITAWFMDRACACGAVIENLKAEALEVGNGRVTGVRTTNRVWSADHVILCAGIGLPNLLNALGLDLAMLNEPGMLATTDPAEPAISAMLATPEVHAWQGEDGRYLIGADFGGGDAPGDADAEAGKLAAALGRLIPAAAGCAVERTTVRERPMPADGRPAIGPFGPKGLYVVSTHSGMTLAPLIGDLVSREIATGETDARLAPYRPDRAALQREEAEA